MKIFNLIILLFVVTFTKAQDPREFNHGSCIVRFMQNDSIKYYLTWSSSYQNSWEHDIYNSVIYYDEYGDLTIQKASNKYIGNGNDEAQEPVNSTYDSLHGNILTVWEDGTGNNAPDVRGQLHKPDGTIIKSNWMIDGGIGSQHSANTAHLSNKYLIFYADEAPPSTGGAVVKCKVIDDLLGTEMQTISLTANNEDHWWPVSVSDKTNTRTLVIWGNDGYAVRGTVLYNNNGIISITQAPQDYLINTQQYYYQVIWLENIAKFLIIARNGAYNNITDDSQICLVDTSGNIVSSKTISGGIVREVKPTAIWSDCTQSYHVFYPIGMNELIHFEVLSNFEINAPNESFTSPDLNNIQWPSTGIWSLFVKDINGNEAWQNNHKILFTFNDNDSNDIVKVDVQINDSVLCQHIGVSSDNNNDHEITVYPNPISNYFFVESPLFSSKRVHIRIYNAVGQLIFTDNRLCKNKRISLNVDNLNCGIYFMEIETDINKDLIKIIKK